MMHTKNRYLSFGVALAAAPVFCYWYANIFDPKVSDHLWLLHDWRSFVWLILFYPVTEEIIFRGFIQEYLYKKTYGKYLLPYIVSFANIITSILFVLIHLVHHSPVWAVLVFFPSLVFGYFKEKFSSVLPSILLHSVYNFACFSFVGK